MYGYSEFVPLNMEEILKRVKQEDIFQMVLGFIPKEYVYIPSPFREDGNPGCYFEWYDGWLWFKDWAKTKKHKDCFNAVQTILGVSFYESLSIINDHFKLGLGTPNTKAPTIELKFTKKKKIISNKKPREIIFKSRPFNNTTDKDFWSKYGIKKSELIQDNIFPVVWYKIFSKRLGDYVVIRPLTRTYALTGFNSRLKIYTPDNKGKGKWITNCTEDDVGSFNDIPRFDDTLIISKSYKDCRVLRNEGINSIWFQNEGMIPKEEILVPLSSRFSRIFVFFDNDKTGLEASEVVVNQINRVFPGRAKSISLPEYLLSKGIKDPSDLYHKKGKDSLIRFLRKNEIL